MNKQKHQLDSKHKITTNNSLYSEESSRIMRTLFRQSIKAFYKSECNVELDNDQTMDVYHKLMGGNTERNMDIIRELAILHISKVNRKTCFLAVRRGVGKPTEVDVKTVAEIESFIHEDITKRISDMKTLFNETDSTSPKHILDRDVTPDINSYSEQQKEQLLKLLMESKGINIDIIENSNKSNATSNINKAKNDSNNNTKTDKTGKTASNSNHSHLVNDLGEDFLTSIPGTTVSKTTSTGKRGRNTSNNQTSKSSSPSSSSRGHSEKVEIVRSLPSKTIETSQKASKNLDDELDDDIFEELEKQNIGNISVPDTQSQDSSYANPASHSKNKELMNDQVEDIQDEDLDEPPVKRRKHSSAPPPPTISKTTTSQMLHTNKTTTPLSGEKSQLPMVQAIRKQSEEKQISISNSSSSKDTAPPQKKNTSQLQQSLPSQLQIIDDDGINNPEAPLKVKETQTPKAESSTPSAETKTSTRAPIKYRGNANAPTNTKDVDAKKAPSVSSSSTNNVSSSGALPATDNTKSKNKQSSITTTVPIVNSNLDTSMLNNREAFDQNNCKSEATNIQNQPKFDDDEEDNTSTSAPTRFIV